MAIDIRTLTFIGAVATIPVTCGQPLSTGSGYLWVIVVSVEIHSGDHGIKFSEQIDQAL